MQAKILLLCFFLINTVFGSNFNGGTEDNSSRNSNSTVLQANNDTLKEIARKAKAVSNLNDQRKSTPWWTCFWCYCNCFSSNK